MVREQQCLENLRQFVDTETEGVDVTSDGSSSHMFAPTSNLEERCELSSCTLRTQFEK